MIRIHGGPHDGIIINDPGNCHSIDIEHFTLGGVDIESYRINRDRTDAHWHHNRTVLR